MKTREQIIRDMCYTWRHDFGLDKNTNDPLSSGMTKSDREFLWQQMAQVYDNCIAPVMQPRVNDQHTSESTPPDRWQKYNWTTWVEP